MRVMTLSMAEKSMQGKSFWGLRLRLRPPRNVWLRCWKKPLLPQERIIDSCHLGEGTKLSSLSFPSISRHGHFRGARGGHTICIHVFKVTGIRERRGMPWIELAIFLLLH